MPLASDPCLQNTHGLSGTVAHLGLNLGRGRWGWLVSDPVVVSLGGQSWTWAGCTNEREASVVADDPNSPPGIVARLRIRRPRSGPTRVHGYWADQPVEVDHRCGPPDHRPCTPDFLDCHAQTATIKLRSGWPSAHARLDSPDLLIRRVCRPLWLPASCRLARLNGCHRFALTITDERRCPVGIRPAPPLVILCLQSTSELSDVVSALVADGTRHHIQTVLSNAVVVRRRRWEQNGVKPVLTWLKGFGAS